MMMHWKKIGLVEVVLCLAAGSVLLASTGGSQAAAGGYCGESIVKDYLAPLKRFPGSEGFADSGKLRVGPAVLRIYPPHEQLVLVGSGGFEARGSLYQIPHQSNPRLGWWIESVLESVNAESGKGKVVKAKQQFVETIKGFKGRVLGFEEVPAPGIYRLRIRIEGKSGKMLTEYSEYYRAVMPRANLRLIVHPTVIGPGETGSLQVENRGTVAATYSFQYRIWRLDGSELPLPPQVSGDVKPIVKAGYLSPCIRLQIPSDTPPGEYRIGLEAKTSGASQRERIRTRLSIGS